MEQQTHENEKVKVYYDKRMLPLVPNSKQTERLFIECGAEDESYKVIVKPVADWFELKGKVDSKRTHDIVLSIVQTNHPYRKLVDHMAIVHSDAEA
ncbi:MAG: hypothetical protein JXR76_08855 [Deltaproteobacteria bacterium]|nr:hypothetical protein [Deltaproteobacteria bacterium]